MLASRPDQGRAAFLGGPETRGYTRDVVLLSLVMRALGVALLTATVLLPVADHHAATRLPEALAQAVSVHDLVTHHHNHRARPGSRERALLAPARELPTVLPSATFWAEGAGAPTAALGGVELPAWLSPLGRLPAVAVALPSSVERAPPQPVPLLPA
jgi:hypothetical protein